MYREENTKRNMLKRRLRSTVISYGQRRLYVKKLKHSRICDLPRVIWKKIRNNSLRKARPHTHTWRDDVCCTRIIGVYSASENVALEYILIWTILTCLLTPWTRVLLEKLIGSQLFKKFPAFYGSRKFITALTSACQLPITWAIWRINK